MEFEQGATERYNRLIIDLDKNATLPISALAEAAYAKNPIPELSASQFKVLGGAVYASASGAPSRAWASQFLWLRASASDIKSTVRPLFGEAMGSTTTRST